MLNSSKNSLRFSISEDLVLDTENGEAGERPPLVINNNYKTLSSNLKNLLMTQHIMETNGVPLSVDLSLKDSLTEPNNSKFIKSN